MYFFGILFSALMFGSSLFAGGHSGGTIASIESPTITLLNESAGSVQMISNDSVNISSIAQPIFVSSEEISEIIDNLETGAIYSLEYYGIPGKWAPIQLDITE